jgi:hypothetical protein
MGPEFRRRHPAPTRVTPCTNTRASRNGVSDIASHGFWRVDRRPRHWRADLEHKPLTINEWAESRVTGFQILNGKVARSR